MFPARTSLAHERHLPGWQTFPWPCSVGDDCVEAMSPACALTCWQAPFELSSHHPRQPHLGRRKLDSRDSRQWQTDVRHFDQLKRRRAEYRQKEKGTKRSPQFGGYVSATRSQGQHVCYRDLTDSRGQGARHAYRGLLRGGLLGVLVDPGAICHAPVEDWQKEIMPIPSRVGLKESSRGTLPPASRCQAYSMAWRRELPYGQKRLKRVKKTFLAGN